jgi:hypothetical protein
MKQWVERLQQFLSVDTGDVGRPLVMCLGWGTFDRRRRIPLLVDVAAFQSTRWRPTGEHL